MIENIQLSHIVEVVAVLIVFFQFGKWLISFGNPIVELKKRVDRHDGLFANDKEKLEQVEARLDRISEGLEIQGKALAELLNHEITGNDIGELRKRHKDLLNFYFDK